MLSMKGKNEPRSQQTRQLLQRALLEILLVKSFEELKIKDITDRAQVNRATFYDHFEDKYELLDTTIREVFMQTVQRHLIKGVVQSRADVAQLIFGVCDFLSNVASECKQTQKRFEVLVEKEVKQQLVDLLRPWIAQADCRYAQAHYNAELAATMASWAIYGAALYWNCQVPRPPVEQFVQLIFPQITGEQNIL